MVEKGIFSRKSPRNRISLVSSNAFPSDSCLPNQAVHFISFPTIVHLSWPICCGSVILRRRVSPVDGAHDSKLLRSMATTATNPVDWKVIWAQRGFRYFFLAMFVSLFGSGMNFAGDRKSIV